MSNEQKFYINGGWVKPTGVRTLDVINPATEKKIAQIALGESEDVDSAVAAAKHALRSYSKTSAVERIALLRRLVDVYQRRSDDIAEAISAEMGSPITIARKAQCVEQSVPHCTAKRKSPRRGFRTWTLSDTFCCP